MTKKQASVHTYRLMLSALVLVVFISAQTDTLLAASGGGSITASPAQIQLEVNKRQPQQSKKITLTNNYDSAVTINAEFRGIDENSELLIPAGPISQSLGKTLNISETEFQIQPHSSKMLTITGTNVDSLSPGGHYAALLLTQRPSDSQQLSLRSAISVNLFFIKTDGAKQSINLEKLQAKSWIFHIASQATVTFSNNGNVQSTPHGAVYILNRKGNLVSKGIINTESQPLFPGKNLTDQISLTRIQRTWYPQKLNLIVSYHPNDLDPVAKTYSFWYVPPFYIAIPLGLIGLGLYIWRKRRIKNKKSSSHVVKKTDDMPKILKIAIRLYGDSNESTTIPVKRKGHLDLKNRKD